MCSMCNVIPETASAPACELLLRSTAISLDGLISSTCKAWWLCALTASACSPPCLSVEASVLGLGRVGRIPNAARAAPGPAGARLHVVRTYSSDLQLAKAGSLSFCIRARCSNLAVVLHVSDNDDKLHVHTIVPGRLLLPRLYMNLRPASSLQLTKCTIGCPVLDRFLRGGLPCGIVIELAGKLRVPCPPPDVLYIAYECPFS